MANGKKKQPAVWLVLVQACGLAMGIYLAGVLLLDLLAVRGEMPDVAAFSMMAALCLMAALAGGLTAVRRMPWGTLPSALLVAACFGAVLLLVGLSCWDSITWGGRGGVLLACVLAGGTLAGVLGGGRKRRRKHS